MAPFFVLEQYNPGRPTIVLDDQGNEWTRFQLDRREPISLSCLPEHLIEAFLSAEDWNFFSHCGIFFKGIVRSLVVNIYHGRRVQGASTITQQLVKLLFFDMKKTFSRKLKEQLYAVIIEQQFTKQQILGIYLNHVYFGCGIYGVEAAAQRFWNTSAADVTVDQAATLAGIIRSPANYCPLLCPLSSENRRNLILQLMYNRAVITKDEYETSLQAPLQVVCQEQVTTSNHIKEMIRQFLEDRVGKKQLYSGGLVVQTSINQRMQRCAQLEFEKQVRHVCKELCKPVDGGLITLDVPTGEIKALVGGMDFSSSHFNRATQAWRQMGSVFKPMVYAAAIEQGMSFADVVVDEPIEVTQDVSVWSPKNFNSKFNGPITRAYALSRSNNIVTIKTLLQTGVHNVIDVAKRCRLSGPFHPYPSLALGCTDATLKQAAAMFNLFANDGVYVEPHCIKWVKDRLGTKIYKCTIVKERVLSSRVVGQVAQVLSLGLKRVHKWFENQWFEGEAISKTGTTNESRTCWYVGSTPALTTAVYVGCDDNASLGRNIYPIRTAFPIWLGFNRTIRSPVKQFSYDPSLRKIRINEKTGECAAVDDAEAIEIFI